MSIAQLLKAIGQRKSKLRYTEKTLHGCSVVNTTKSRPALWMLRHIPLIGKIMRGSIGSEGKSLPPQTHLDWRSVGEETGTEMETLKTKRWWTWFTLK